MAERPILFSAPMVRALLAGTKTQTRRVMTRQKQNDFTDYTLFGQQGYNAGDWHAIEHAPDWPDGKEDQCFCPYARQRGDRLWVRESWRLRGIGEAARDAGPRSDYVYRATENVDGLAERWKPSIHMPRVASRILLEVTDVRVQQLQEISDPDAIAEGIEPYTNHPGRWLSGHRPGLNYPSATAAYRDLWESINGEGSWDANPWVWAITFRRIQP